MEPHHWFCEKTKTQQPKQVSHSQTRSYNLTPEKKTGKRGPQEINRCAKVLKPH